MEKNPAEYWLKLSFEERETILKEGGLFVGFSHYLWEYLPESFHSYIEDKIEQERNES